MTDTSTTTTSVDEEPIAVFMDPPEPSTVRGRNAVQMRRFIDFLKANPGRSAKATFVVAGAPATRDGFKFEVRQVPNTEPKRYELYGKFTPKAVENGEVAGG